MKRAMLWGGAIAIALTALIIGRTNKNEHVAVDRLTPVVHAADPTSAPTVLPQASAPKEGASVKGTESVYRDVGFREGEATLSPSARAGREIWYRATAGNARFHTYVFQQRIGTTIDWFRVLRSDRRGQRFHTWGLINDPDCCTPGSPNCPAKRSEETYGFDYCPGDEELLKYVGKSGYRDPACDFQDAALDSNDPHAANNKDQRQSACDLEFGTSTGALGFRKFPNPRFDAEKWKALNGGQLASWEAYGKKLSDRAELSDSRVSRLMDGSIEPPFLIGTSCGSCHIAFDPLNPPTDSERPEWHNIKGLVGNQYTRISEIMVSGMPTDSLNWQVFAHARPGTSDTSAIPTDQVNNPGTINAILNTSQRPTFPGEEIIKWRKTNACQKEELQNDTCWCEPGRDNKCWRRSRAQETVHHILKGGEDSIGALEAIQRVYFNIGSCAEACWVNHLTDLYQFDPQQRNFGQTPFNIGQCRRDCPNFRAIEDRLPNILAFFTSSEGHATDLAVARANAAKQKNSKATYGYDDLVEDLEKEFGKGAVARGQKVFAETCARCHSSVPESKGGAFATRDFHKIDDKTKLREDWMGSDVSTPATEVDTYRCRALHSNHMAGHVWQEYGSETLRARGQVPGINEASDGGRGYYRNISLLSVWAHAPFLHNNALGPELCGFGGKGEYDFYRPSYVDKNNNLLPAKEQPACWTYDPSVEGRFKLFKASMRELLHPDQRIPKITKLDQDIVLDLGPKVFDGKDEDKLFGFTLRVPAGSTAAALGNFQHKQFVADLVLAKFDRKKLEAKRGKGMADEIAAVASEILAKPDELITAVKKRPELLKFYSTCLDVVENKGHRFGQDLSEVDKNALIAFLATL
ncbi:MAG TPA: hypothetical protein VFB54_16390 [Burkholderiales bacterium]|nr:hypothetical protein [Burkholderiales bacterium]